MPWTTPEPDSDPEIHRTRAALANRPGLFIAGCVDPSKATATTGVCPTGSSFAFYGGGVAAFLANPSGVVALSCRQGQPVCSRAIGLVTDPEKDLPPCSSPEQRAIVCRQ